MIVGSNGSIVFSLLSKPLKSGAFERKQLHAAAGGHGFAIRSLDSPRAEKRARYSLEALTGGVISVLHESQEVNRRGYQRSENEYNTALTMIQAVVE